MYLLQEKRKRGRPSFLSKFLEKQEGFNFFGALDLGVWNGGSWGVNV